jgi:hypothetical protein
MTIWTTQPAGGLCRTWSAYAHIGSSLSNSTQVACTFSLIPCSTPAARPAPSVSVSSWNVTPAASSVCDFADVERRANGLVAGLEQVILGMEPRTPSETLSLALVLADELDVPHRPLRLRGGRGEPSARRCAPSRHSRACVRATSPLTKTYSSGNTLFQWDAARSTAVREADYLVGDAVDLDAFAGETRQ